MGRKEFERTSERLAPATPQSPEELSLAQNLHEEIDALLGERNSRFFDFSGKRPLKAGYASFEAIVILERIVFGVEDVLLFSSGKWPTPRGTAARLSRAGSDYYVEVGHVRLTLHGTYPRVDYIVPEDSLEAMEEEKRNGADGFGSSFHPIDPSRKVIIPARDGSLRPRIERLRYGEFLVSRIIQAEDSGKDVLLK